MDLQPGEGRAPLRVVASNPEPEPVPWTYDPAVAEEHARQGRRIVEHVHEGVMIYHIEDPPDEA
jgi:hypothetical protein